VIEVRRARPDEYSDAFVPLSTAFSFQPGADWIESRRRIMPPERLLVAVEDGVVVGSAGAHELRLTVPGGDLSAAGVTWVAVLPTHTRRGVLTAMTRRQLDDCRARGEAVAVLWASEAAIYGRFGYGCATLSCEIDLARDRAVFSTPFERTGRVRLLGRDEALRALSPLYDRVRRAYPGMLARTEPWWEEKMLTSPDYATSGAPLQWAAVALDGADEAYAGYRVEPEWEQGSPAAELHVVEALAVSPRATREVWSYLFGIDLVARVRARRLPVDHPLFQLVAEPARLRMRVGDGLWLRLVDVEAALGARALREATEVVVELADDLCPWNAGRWRIGPRGATRTDEPLELRLDTGALASAYLGGFTFASLAAAGRVEELTAGALERADGLFRCDRSPWCPEVF
jgi:predicted acetyltransferase